MGKTKKTINGQTKPIWDQLPDESANAYELFSRYRDQGVRRTLRSVRPGDPTNPKGYVDGDVIRLAKKYRWRERAWSWDDHVQRQRDRDARALVVKLEQERLEAYYAAMPPLALVAPIAKKARKKAWKRLLGF